MKEDHNHVFNTDYLLRYIEQKLTDAEVRHLESGLKQSQHLRDELAHLKATQALLHQAATTSAEDVLAPFFTDRLMKKLAPEAAPAMFEEELANLLSRLFRPVAVVGLFLALCLAIYNINLSNGYSSDPSAAESIFAVPPITSMAVYDLDYYSAQNVTAP